jgi:hypothetical protein
MIAHHTVTSILAEARIVEEATPKILRALCESLGWDVGALWRLDREVGVLRCAELWCASPGESRHFLTTTRDSAFRTGIGLPGQVWASRKPACLFNLELNRSVVCMVICYHQMRDVVSRALVSRRRIM